jgi:hypothetical protein
MLLPSIVLGTGIAGLGSVLLATLISPSASSKFVNRPGFGGGQLV